MLSKNSVLYRFLCMSWVLFTWSPVREHQVQEKKKRPPLRGYHTPKPKIAPIFPDSGCSRYPTLSIKPHESPAINSTAADDLVFSFYQHRATPRVHDKKMKRHHTNGQNEKGQNEKQTSGIFRFCTNFKERQHFE